MRREVSCAKVTKFRNAKPHNSGGGAEASEEHLVCRLIFSCMPPQIRPRKVLRMAGNTIFFIFISALADFLVSYSFVEFRLKRLLNFENM